MNTRFGLGCFIQVSEDDEEQTATAGFEDDEEFIDDLSGDMEDDEIDGEVDKVPASMADILST